MSMVSIEIDGAKYDAQEGETVLEAANREGIRIPTLCYSDFLEVFGACRLCVVEILRDGWTQLATACTLPVKEGLRVLTDSEKVVKSRKMTIELLLARCPQEEVLLDLAREYGIEEHRFQKRDDNCILCGLCVRMCERMGVNAIDFTGRGMDRELGTPYMEESDVCITCGSCYSICPTSRYNRRKVERTSGNTAKPLTNEFEMDLGARRVINIPMIQAVPRVVAIDKEHCVHMNTGACGICYQVCDRDAIDYEMKDKIIEFEAGNIIVATGFDVWDPASAKEYGSGRYPNVLTALEFERLMNVGGPTGGMIRRRSDGKEPQRIAWILGIGPRDHERTGVDSTSISYTYAIKQAILAKETLPQMSGLIFHREFQNFGKGSYEHMIKGAKEHGIKYIDSEVKIKEEPESHDLVLTYVQDGKSVTQPVDMVVLAPMLIPRKGTLELAQRLGIETDERGFFKSSEKIYSDLQSTKDGIYIIGFCNQPMNISESITTANAAAARIAERLTKKEG